MMRDMTLRAVTLVATLLLAGATNVTQRPEERSWSICQTDECWSLSNSLHASLNTSASPCGDFEEFLCGGFRSSHQFSRRDILSGRAYLDYMETVSSALSRRVTEQLATSWGDDAPGRPVSPKLLGYERSASEALADCIRLEGGNRTLHDLVMDDPVQVVEEAIDLGTEGLKAAQLRLESLLPIQANKGLYSPLTVLTDMSYRMGRPALLVVSMPPFTGLFSVSAILSYFPMQTSRIFRSLRMPLPGGLPGLLRYAAASILLWDYACNRTATVVVGNSTAAGGQRVRTVADAKRLLGSANLTFDLDAFLRASVAPDITVVNDTTDLVLSDTASFVHTVCLLDHCSRRRPDLLKVLVMQQIGHLLIDVLSMSKDADCVTELFGPASSSNATAGAFRPLLYGRYVRAHASPRVEAEASVVFDGVKAAYSAGMTSQAWIPDDAKTALRQQLERVYLKFSAQTVSEANLVRRFRGVMDSMPAGCSLSANAACLMVRASALQSSLATRMAQTRLDLQSPHYDTIQGAVFLTSAFANPPHFRAGVPLAATLGSLGFVFAHELSHGVTSEAEPADQLVKQKDHLPSGWSADFLTEFRRRESCLRDRMATDQPGLNKTSVSEDVADLVALSTVSRMLRSSGDTRRLPGYMARFSPAQLLYITSFRTFCSKGVPAFWHHFLAESRAWSHTPGQMRIRAVLAGDAHFAGAFGCPPVVAESGKPRCEFW